MQSRLPPLRFAKAHIARAPAARTSVHVEIGFADAQRLHNGFTV